MQSNKDRKVLQKCLPGVTIDSPLNTPQQSYQSLQVERSHRRSHSTETSILLWKEQDQFRRRQQRTTRSWNAFLILLGLMLILSRWWHNHHYHYKLYKDESDGSNIALLQVDDGGDDDDDDHQKDILHALTKLDEEMEGDIILVSSREKFQLAARAWQHTALIDPPMAVVEAKTQEDVEKALPILAGLARDFHLQFRVRSGGHNYAGYSTIPNGVVLSLSKLNSLKVQKIINNNTKEVEFSVIMEPGVRVEQFQQTVLDQEGCSGIVADAARVGMGGFVLGGGYGLQSRMYGLGIDNILRAKVVLTNGDVKEVEEGDDLFWALRGAGGGNLGVVTEMEYRVHPSRDMKVAATVKIPFRNLPSFLQKLGEKEPELTGEFIAMVQGYEPPPNNTTIVANRMKTTMLRQARFDQMDKEKIENGTATVTLYWMGDSDPDSPVGMQYIKTNVIPLFENDGNQVDPSYYYFSWSAISRQREQAETWTKVYAAQSWNGFLFPANNTQEVWDDIRESMSLMFRYCNHATPNIQLWGGAISKIPGNATAFPYRQAVYNIGVQLLIPNGTNNDTQEEQKLFEEQSALVGAIWSSIANYLTGVYVNYPMPSLSREEYPRAYWGNNLDRLVNLKQRYDPFQTFRFDQSVPKPNRTKHFF